MLDRKYNPEIFKERHYPAKSFHAMNDPQSVQRRNSLSLSGNFLTRFYLTNRLLRLLLNFDQKCYCFSKTCKKKKQLEKSASQQISFYI